MSVLPKIDVHIHVVGTGCCDSKCMVSKDFKQRYTFKLIKFMMGITDAQLTQDIDETWIQMIASKVSESEVDYGVLLGFDHVIKDGAPDLQKTQLHVPNDWVFQQCEEHPNLLPGPSINPNREDALDLLDACFAKKAVLLKWLPSTQVIDPADKKFKPFYQRLADLGLPLLVHIGGERTFKSYNPEYNFFNRLELAFDLGVKVICAHSGTPILGSSEKNQYQDLIYYLKKYPNIWVDNSGMCNPGRFHHTSFFAKHDLIRARTLYGSDWPVPSNAFYFLNKLGPMQTYKLEKIKNYFQRDLQTKRALGYPDTSLTTANQVLANLNHWL